MKQRFNFRYKKLVAARYLVTSGLFAVAFIILIVRLYILQISSHCTYRDLATNNRTVMVELPPQRGLIMDRIGNELAINVPKYSVYAIPRYITNKKETAEVIADTFNKAKEEVLDKISGDKMFVWIARKIPDDQLRKAKTRNIENIGYLIESERSYPHKSLAAHVVGFVDIDNVGLEGIELYYDEALRGVAGYKVCIVDAKRRQVGSSDARFMSPHDGFNLILTIDSVIQHISENALSAAVERHSPSSASVVVMNPRNGDVLALCNWPTYDLNGYAMTGAGERKNRAISDIIEPGSSFKIVTATAALEEEVTGPDEEFYCENGSYHIAGRVLNDLKPHGTLAFKNIIEKSSNIGTVKVAQKLGGDRLYKYIKRFGFGGETGIDLPGEVAGIVRSISQWSQGSIAAVPIGHEVAATTLQLAVAISCLANDGILVKPRIVKKIVDHKNVAIKEFPTQLVARVMSKETSFKMKGILRMVVESGTGKRAAISGYSAAGKTGTAQRLNADGTYSHKKFNSVFIGFAPADSPSVAIAVVFVEPHPYYYGGTVAAPVFAEIAEKTLRYLGVSPESEIRL